MCHLWDALIKSYDAHPYTAHRKACLLKAYIQQNFGLRLVRGMELPPTTPSHMWIYSCPWHCALSKVQEENYVKSNQCQNVK